MPIQLSHTHTLTQAKHPDQTAHVLSLNTQTQAKLDIQTKKLELEQARVVRQHNEEYEVRFWQGS